jgi:nickel transport protein
VRSFVVALALWLATASAGLAHHVIAAVWSIGDAIEGEFGFSSGDLAPTGTVVRALGPDGAALGETMIEADGLFRFVPTAAVAHRFVADLGQGHVAEITLAVDELPASLAVAASPAVAALAASAAAPEALDIHELEQIVATAVQRELAPLKRELARRHDEASLQSIVAGLGYIAGIFGLLFFVQARRQRA